MSEPSARASSLAMAALAAWIVGLLGFAFVLAFVAPAHERVFADMLVKMPRATELVLVLSRLFVRYWFLAVPGVVVVVAASVVGCAWGRGRRWVAGVFGVLALISALTCAGAYLALRLQVERLQDAIGPAPAVDPEAPRPR